MYLDLISYRKCGSTWVKYFIQYVTGMGFIHYGTLFDSDKVFGKSHGYHPLWFRSVKEAGSRYRQIFVIRNYKECIYRGGGVTTYEKFIDELTDDSRFNTRGKREQPYYMNLLEQFDKITLPKLLIYYEDLFERPEIEFKRIYLFLIDIYGIDKVKGLDQFLDNLDKHIRKSLDWYKINVDVAAPLPSTNIIYHSLKMTRELRLKLDTFVHKNYHELYHKYLIKYSELGGEVEQVQ